MSKFNTYIECDLDKAREIYSKIKDKYTDIDDETLVNIFKNELQLVLKK